MEIFFSLLDSTLRVATPLILAAMAGMFSERSGVVDISLEGKMLVAAFAAAAAAFTTQNPWIGMACGIAASVAMAMIHAFVSVTYNGNQLISGMALNTVASGITPVLGLAWFQQGGNTRSCRTRAVSTRSCCRSPMSCAMCRCWASCTASCCPATAFWCI